MIVYVSSPYSADTIEQITANVELASEMSKKVLLAGHVPVAPHVTSALWDRDGRLQHFSHLDWLLKYSIPILETADAILMAGSWESSLGCQIELDHAKNMLKKKVFYSIEELEKGGNR